MFLRVPPPQTFWLLIFQDAISDPYLGAILASLFRLAGGVLAPLLLGRCGAKVGKRGILIGTSLLMG